MLLKFAIQVQYGSAKAAVWLKSTSGITKDGGRRLNGTQIGILISSHNLQPAQRPFPRPKVIINLFI